MVYPFGIFIAVCSLFAAIAHLNQHVGTYYDFVAFVIVLGGTLAVAVATFPWQYRQEIFILARQLFGAKDFARKLFLAECVNFVRQAGASSNVQMVGLAGTVLRDGSELIALGFAPEKIEEILETRIEQTSQRNRKIANAFRSLAKYPPAFGLVGTVLGLVNLMRSVSSGADARETGVQMAVALVATLYGLLTANLLVGPAGEQILRRALEDQKMGEVALRAVILAMSGTGPLEAQEILNSFVPREDRIDVTGSLSERAGAAA